MCSKISKEEESDVMLSLWQHNNFETGKPGSKPCDKAQTYLSNILQMSLSLDDNDPTMNYQIADEMNSYGNIIDESDLEIGVDNYSAAVLEQTNQNIEMHNEKWTSCLDIKSVMEWPEMKTFMNKPNQWEKDVEKKCGRVKFLKPKISPVQSSSAKFNLKKVASPVQKKTSYQMPSIKSQFESSSSDEDEPHFTTQLSSRFPKKRKTEVDPREKGNCFRSARDQLAIEEALKGNKRSHPSNNSKRNLGSRPRGQCYAKFVPPNRGQNENEDKKKLVAETKEPEHPKLKGIEPQLIELIKSEIMDHGNPIEWSDIAGLEYAKETIKEIVIWPMLRPDLFTGLRGPPKGMLLFGPPGTGKTLIGKCIASQSKATFFSISASSLTSKWIGQGEKMVRALFAVAQINQPAVIFIDEIDSLLSQRSESEHESSRRIKTEFLVQLDGATTSSDDRILVVGATNRPQEIDEAARRRLVKRLYIPLPEYGAREQIIQKLLDKQEGHTDMTSSDIGTVVQATKGFSGADVTNLCKEAALGPIRSIRNMDIATVTKDDVPPIRLVDFKNALKHVKSSVSPNDLKLYLEWNKTYGCGSI